MELNNTKSTISPQAKFVLHSLEAIAISIGAFFVGWMINSNDPLLMSFAFPWLTLVPLVLSLYAGFIVGLLSLTLLLACSITYASMVQSLWILPSSLLAGGLFCCVIGGFFRYINNKSDQNQQIIINYLKKRLQGLSNDYLLLRQSHHNIESESNIPTLYSTINSIRYQMLSSTGDRSPLQQCGHSIMQLLKQYGQVQVGAFFLVKDNDIDLSTAMVRLGRLPNIRKDDYLIRYAIENKKPYFINHEHLKSGGKNKLDTNFLATIPFIDHNNIVRGVLAIRQMPCSGISYDNLNNIMIFCRYIAETLNTVSMLSTHENTKKEQVKNYQLYEFHAHLKMCIKNLVSFGLPVGIIAIKVKNPTLAPAVVDNIINNKEMLDIAIAIKDAHREHQTILLLKPLATMLAVEKYIKDFPDFLLQQLQVSMITAQTSLKSFTISDLTQQSQLLGFLEEQSYPLSHIIHSNKNDIVSIDKKITSKNKQNKTTESATK